MEKLIILFGVVSEYVPDEKYSLVHEMKCIESQIQKGNVNENKIIKFLEAINYYIDDKNLSSEILKTCLMTKS